MSLNLRISRPRPRKSRSSLLWLMVAIFVSAGWVAWLQGWQPKESLTWLQGLQLEGVAAKFSRNVLPHVPVEIPQLQSQPALPQQTQINSVVMVAEHIIENPQSNAYTADLYAATGKDTIPWPNVDGRTKVEIYKVQSGDSLWSIAGQFGLDIDSLRWANIELEQNPDVLSVGAELRILPVQGAYHVVEANDTLESIAVKYGVSPTDIADYPPNALFAPQELKNVKGLIIPFGRKGVVPPKPSPSAGADLAWPVVGFITTDFMPEHKALDIGAPYGSTVYAAEAGTITYADWAYEGYGYTVVIDHGNGRESWYNHLKGALLPAGNVVGRGTPVGEVGSTGHSTGPHVHFEFRIDGKQVNPTNYLPGSTPQ